MPTCTSPTTAPNLLFANQGNGTFAETGALAGVADDGYGTACAFGDYDNDGDLDLFAGNYVVFDPETTLLPGEQRGGFFGGQRGIASVASPEAFAGQPDVLYRNDGNGAFADVSTGAGLNAVLGKTLGATFLDWNDDGDLDLYVANDATPNFLYTNQGDGTFAEEALALGVAYDADGRPEGSMGLAAGDWDNDGDLDLAVSNYEGQTATLHRNDGRAFANMSFAAGVARTTLMPLQWGTAFFDWDRDGDLDLFIANGHVTAALEDYFPQSSYAQQNNLFRNDGAAFVDLSAQAGPGLQIVKSSRGTAVGDYDNDGDEDLFVVNKNDVPTLLRNDTASDNHWLTVRTLGRTSNRDGIGARVRLVVGDQQQLREVAAGSSYLSHNSLWLTFGLGPSAAVDTLRNPLAQRFNRPIHPSGGRSFCGSRRRAGHCRCRALNLRFFPHSAEDLLRHALQVLIVANVDNGAVLLDGRYLIALLLQDGSQPKARAGKVGLEADGLLIDLNRSTPIAASVERGP